MKNDEIITFGKINSELFTKVFIKYFGHLLERDEMIIVEMNDDSGKAEFHVSMEFLKRILERVINLDSIKLQDNALSMLKDLDLNIIDKPNLHYTVNYGGCWLKDIMSYWNFTINKLQKGDGMIIQREIDNYHFSISIRGKYSIELRDELFFKNWNNLIG